MGKVKNVGGAREVGWGDGEVLGRFVELNCTCWGAVGRREVERGDGEVLERSIKLDGARRSLEVNDEAGRVESMPITSDVGGGVGGGEGMRKHSPQT